MSARNNKHPGIGMWMVSQVLALIYVIIAIIAMIATSKSSTFGVAIFFIMLWNVIILIGLFVMYITNNLYFTRSDLFHGMYCGVTLIEGLNIFVEGAVLIAEASVIAVIEGTGFARTMYIILAIISFVLAIAQLMYVKLAFLSIK